MFRARSLRNVRSGSHSLALCQLGRKSVWASHRVQEVKFSTGRHSGAPRAIRAEMNRSRNGRGDVGQSLGSPALRPAILPSSWAWGQPKPNPGHGPVTAAAEALCLSLAAQAVALRSGRLSPACSLGRSSPSLRMGRVWKGVCVVVKAPAGSTHLSWENKTVSAAITSFNIGAIAKQREILRGRSSAPQVTCQGLGHRTERKAAKVLFQEGSFQVCEGRKGAER